MLQEIGTVERIPEFIKRAKDKDDSFRLMGFGHRVYKNYDPRAKIMQKTCHEVLEAVGLRNDPILKVALELERIALSDDYFIQKKLYPISISIRGLRSRRSGSRPTCSPSCLPSRAPWAGLPSGKR